MKRPVIIALVAVFVSLAAFLLVWPRPLAQGSGLAVPKGFTVSLYAEGFSQPRFMAQAPNGDVFVSDMAAGKVMVLRDVGGVSEAPKTFASNLTEPHGLAFHGGFLYVANTDGVVRFPYRYGDTEAQQGPEKIIDLPAGGHSTRTIVFGPDGRLYVSVGSTGNANEETDARRAAIWAYDANGLNGRLYASGLRNAVGLAWAGDRLYATTNGVDHLGDDLPREALFQLKDGGFYGWPYCYVTDTAKPQAWDADFGRKSAGICKTAEMPLATFVAHAAPLGLASYEGSQFPAQYRGKLFVALHGSWVPRRKVGYKVVMVDPASGGVEDFVTGFLSGQEVSGRPVDLVVAKDGALLLTDDGAGKVWRIGYQG